MRVVLIVNEGPLLGTVAQIHVGHYLVGRHSECQIRPESPSVSERHCLLWNDGNQFGVTDLQSSRGTFVNQTRLEPHIWKVLREGDILRVGDLSMKVSILNPHSDGVASSPAAGPDRGQRIRTQNAAETEPEVSVAAAQDDAVIATRVESPSATVVDQPQKKTVSPKASPTKRSPVEGPKRAKHRSPSRRPLSLPRIGFEFEHGWKVIAMFVVTALVFCWFGYQTYQYQRGEQLEVRRGLD